MLGALAVSLGLTLWNNGRPLGWRQIVVAALLLVQMALYVGAILLGRPGFPTQRRLVVYFVICLAIWVAETGLVPQVRWVVFAYVGQMFGVLPVRIALPMTALVVLIFSASQAGERPEHISLALFLGMLAQWGSMIVLMVYLSHLAQASQERGRLIAELEAAKKELEAARQRDAELAVLRERERLARDLHDSLGHVLVALSVQLEAIQRLYRVDPERASAQVDELKVLTRSSMDALRRSVAGLRASGLGDRGLRSALQSLCVDWGQRTGVQVACQMDAVADLLGPALAEAIWRVAQESLTNVEKHARARTVRLSLKGEPGRVVLGICDDGIGLPDGAEAAPNCFGLRGMRERVEGLGGTLALQGSPGGTMVEARLPFESQVP